ncbi:MAG: DUF3164 family protein [Sphaerochaetaceae bacterium]|nr:DUF3164 family protein [Sphaerochaetaceae bacterium]
MKEIVNGTIYYKDAKGNLIPEDFIKPVDQLRDDLIERIIKKTTEIKETMEITKKGILEDIEAFMDISAAEYGIKMGGKKGNLTLTTFDGQYKISLKVSERQSFTEGVYLGKEIIDKCIERWSNGANANLKIIVNQAFQLNQSGKMDIVKILSLRKLDIKDEEWKKAMDIISDSIQVDMTKTYFQIYKRNKEGVYQHINLNFSDM